MMDIEQLYLSYLGAKVAAELDDDPLLWDVAQAAYQAYVNAKTAAEIAEIQADYDRTIADFMTATRI